MMPTIKINNINYETDNLSQEAKQHLQMLSITESEIKRLQVQLAITQTAKNAYVQAFVKLAQPLPAGDTIKL